MEVLFYYWVKVGEEAAAEEAAAEEAAAEEAEEEGRTDVWFGAVDLERMRFYT